VVVGVHLTVCEFVISVESMALKLEDLLVEEKVLYVPPAEDVVKALKDGLSKNFGNVDVSVVDCPDLKNKPFSLAAQGLGGSPTIVEVGGVPYLLPLVNRSKIYDFKDINRMTGINPAFVVGAGAGPFTYAGVNCELVANLVVENDRVNSLTQIAKLKDESKGDEMEALTLPDSESTYALMGNLYVSEGKPGKVFKVSCSKRTGKDDFVKAARESLLAGFPGKAIGVGGTFLVTNSKVKQHVMPDFSKTPLNSDDDVNRWLRFYDMNPPLVAVGTFVTNDPGLNLRVIHFHSLSDHGEAGHYHYDTQPDTVEYLGYFNLGTRVIRVDRPPESSKLGHN